MAREVKKVYIFIDPKNNQRELALTTNDLLNEQTRFYINLLKKDYDKVINELVYYSTMFSKIDPYELDEYIHHFPEFMMHYINIYQSIYKKYPNKVKKACHALNGSVILKQNRVLIYDSFIDNKYEMIDFAILSDDITMTPVNSYPLIPEYAERMYNDCMSLRELKSDEGKMLFLSMGEVFFKIMCDRYSDNDLFIKMYSDIKKKLDGYNEKYIDYCKFIDECLVYSVNYVDSICTDLYMFTEYLIKKMIKDKNIQALEELRRNVLPKPDAKSFDCKQIASDIGDFIYVYNFTEEYTCYLDIKNRESDLNVVNAFRVLFYSYYPTDEYQDLLNETNGNQRTNS